MHARDAEKMEDDEWTWTTTDCAAACRWWWRVAYVISCIYMYVIQVCRQQAANGWPGMTAKGVWQERHWQIDDDCCWFGGPLLAGRRCSLQPAHSRYQVIGATTSERGRDAAPKQQQESIVNQLPMQMQTSPPSNSRDLSMGDWGNQSVRQSVNRSAASNTH